MLDSAVGAVAATSKVGAGVNGVALEEYLRADLEPDADFVDGEVEDRFVGE